MLEHVLLILLGLTLLVWSADRFVFGAAAIAKNFGISPLIIGLTIVAMGSSAPEMLVAVQAALTGKTSTAVGNAIGSNITNILLVLGMTALIRPLTVQSRTVMREIPVMLLICLMGYWMLHDNHLSRTEGVVLMIGFVGFILTLIKVSMRQSSQKDPLVAEMEAEIPKDVSNKRALFWLIVGLVVLPLSAQVLVDSAVVIAKMYGISDLVIGLTIIAIGTSLPELAASIMGALKNEDDLAIGNIVGSNIFNILAVLSLPGVINPDFVDPDASARDFPIMLLASIVLMAMAFGFKRDGRINRLEGLILFISFIAYQLVLFSQTVKPVAP